MKELTVIERHLELVIDPIKYRTINEAHSLPGNRRGGLPHDEARQALASHYTRLNNMDKSRLGDDEKKLIDVRKYTHGNTKKSLTARFRPLNFDF